MMNIETEVILEQINKLNDLVSETVEKLNTLDYKVTLIDMKLRENDAYPKKPRMTDHLPDDKQFEKWEEEELQEARRSLLSAKTALDQFDCMYTTPKTNTFEDTGAGTDN